MTEACGRFHRLLSFVHLGGVGVERNPGPVPTMTPDQLTQLLRGGHLDLPFVDIEPLPVKEGNFSCVYRARCARRNVPVVLKFALPDLGKMDPLRSVAFEREASILGALVEKKNVTKLVHGLARVEYVLKDPNLAAVISFRYFGLALYPETLLDLITSRARPFHEMMTVFRGVVQGMNQVHAESVCHRDLKPSNCFVDGDEAFVGDFGCARRNSTEDSIGSGDSYRWKVWGDTRYVAPEIFLGVDRFSILLNADFYSLGCVLFEICTGTILADVVRPAIEKLWAANQLLSGPPSARARQLASGIVRDLELSGYLPDIGLQLPLPGPVTREQVQRLFERLCCFDPQKRLTSFDEVFLRTDKIITTARDEYERTRMRS